MGRVAVVLGLVLASGALSGCVQRCVVGDTITCACTDGRAGRQVCNGLGNFQPCTCKSLPDAGLPGVDAGTCFSTSLFSVGLNPPLRLAVGASATVQASSLSTRDPLRYRWTLHGEPVDAGPTYSQSALSVAFDRPGTWWVEADVTSLDFGDCQVGHGRERVQERRGHGLW